MLKDATFQGFFLKDACNITPKKMFKDFFSRISFQGFLFKDACNITVPGNMTEMIQCETDVKAFGGEHSNHQHHDMMMIMIMMLMLMIR